MRVRPGRTVIGPAKLESAGPRLDDGPDRGPGYGRTGGPGRDRDDVPGGLGRPGPGGVRPGAGRPAGTVPLGRTASTVAGPVGRAGMTGRTGARPTVERAIARPGMGRDRDGLPGPRWRRASSRPARSLATVRAGRIAGDMTMAVAADGGGAVTTAGPGRARRAGAGRGLVTPGPPGPAVAGPVLAGTALGPVAGQAGPGAAVLAARRPGRAVRGPAARLARPGLFPSSRHYRRPARPGGQSGAAHAARRPGRGGGPPARPRPAWPRTQSRPTGTPRPPVSSQRGSGWCGSPWGSLVSGRALGRGPGRARVARRLTGRSTYLPMMADSERALGRLDRALDLVTGPQAEEADRATRVELKIVESGIRRDQGLPGAAVVALQIPELTDGRQRRGSARRDHAYADALLDAGRDDEAREWFARAAGADTQGDTMPDERFDELDQLAIEDLQAGDDEAGDDEAGDDEARGRRGRGRRGAGTTRPGTTRPGTTRPGTTRPGTTRPGTTRPGTTRPGTTRPGTTRPARTSASRTTPTTSRTTLTTRTAGATIPATRTAKPDPVPRAAPATAPARSRSTTFRPATPAWRTMTRKRPGSPARTAPPPEAQQTAMTAGPETPKARLRTAGIAPRQVGPWPAILALLRTGIASSGSSVSTRSAPQENRPDTVSGSFTVQTSTWTPCAWARATKSAPALSTAAASA